MKYLTGCLMFVVWLMLPIWLWIYPAGRGINCTTDILIGVTVGMATLVFASALPFWLFDYYGL